MQLRIASRQATYWLDGNFLECPQCLNLGCQCACQRWEKRAGRSLYALSRGAMVGPPFSWHTVAGALVPQLLARRPTRTPQYR